MIFWGPKTEFFDIPPLLIHRGLIYFNSLVFFDNMTWKINLKKRANRFKLGPTIINCEPLKLSCSKIMRVDPYPLYDFFF